MGCDNLKETTYKTFTLAKGIAHYSFEYRTYYKPKNPSTSDDKYSGVALDGPIINDIKSYTQIYVQVWVPSSGRFIPPDAKTMLEGDLKMRSEVFESKILDQSELTIDLVLAEQLVYSERDIGPPLLGIREKYYIVTRRVYFDHNRLIWRITMASDSSTAEADKADFEHLLKTFKFLP